MRLHQFETDDGKVWVDLDQAHTIKRHDKFPKEWSVVAMPNGCVVVHQPIEDVITLISPPAAPDTYEEELRERKDSVAQMMSDGERRIRLDELYLLEKARRRARSDAAMGKARPAWLDEHIFDRREIFKAESL